MNGMVFQRPDVAWALVAAVLVFVIVQWRRRRHFAAIATHGLLASSTYRASVVRRLPAAVGGLALVAMVLALMDPVVPYGEERTESVGLDIAMVLDLSSSMEERMGSGSDPSAQQTRLDVTKRVIADFIRSRPEDRIGLVVFSDNAYVVSPLTLDHGYLQRYIAMIDSQILRGEGMTAIGEGLNVANVLLARQAVPNSHRDRVIVLLTDGETNFGRDPVETLQEARNAGTRVHMIAVDLDDEIKHKPAVMRLVRAVQRHGGRYFTADTAAQLTGAARAIDSLETGVVVSSRSVRNAPAFDPFAGAGILLICVALAARSVPFFIDLT
jgi:Ca-activated chloride channel family protein